jgi:hypothetical protein
MTVLQKLRGRFAGKSDDELAARIEEIRGETRALERERNGRLPGQAGEIADRLVGRARALAASDLGSIAVTHSTVDGLARIGLPPDPDRLPDALIKRFVVSTPAFRDWLVAQLETLEAEYALTPQRVAEIEKTIASLDDERDRIGAELAVRAAERPKAEADAAWERAVERAEEVS